MKKIYCFRFGSKTALWYASEPSHTLEEIAMYTDLWIIEWREPGCDDVVRTATTAEDAVEIIQRMLENETAFDEAGDDDLPAVDAFFDGEEPICKLRNLFEATRQECNNGTLLVRRAIEMKTPKSSPVERTNQFEKGMFRITEELVRKVKEDFLEWSGGDPPESEMQIFVYVEYARTIEDEDAVREILVEWQRGVVNSTAPEAADQPHLAPAI